MFIEATGPADVSAGPMGVPQSFFFSGFSGSVCHILFTSLAAGELFTETRGRDTNRMRSDKLERSSKWLHWIGDEHQSEDRPSPPQDGVIQRAS